MPNKRDKTTGLPYPDPVVPPTNLCVQLLIPNDPLYVQAFRGVLSDLGKNWTWAQTAGEDNQGAYDAAELWRDRLQSITMSEECDSPVSCDDVTTCIQTNGGTRDAIKSITNTQIPFPTTYPVGVPNPYPTVNLAGTTNPDCDPDILWSQCEQLILKTESAITDVFEAIEVVTNSVELVDAASEFPLVGWAKEVLGGQVALDLIEYYQEAIAEEFMGQMTDAYRIELQCALFCLAKSDCEITIDRLYELFKGRVEEHFAVPDIFSMLELIDFVAGVSQNSTFVVDLAFFFAWGSAKLGSFLFGEVFDTSLQLILALAVNDANDDWTLLCTDCPTDDCYVWNLRLTSGSGDSINGTNDFGPTYGTSVWASGIGYEYQSFDNRAASVKITFPSPLYVRNFSFTVGDNPDSGTLFRHYSRVDGGSEAFMTPNAGDARRATREIELEISSISTLVEVPDTFLAPPIINLQIEFSGDMPSWTLGETC